MSLATLPAVPFAFLQLPEMIQQYFTTFNQGRFHETAALFSPQGQLIPPMDAPVVGPQAIQAYLQQEAMGMEIELEQQLALPGQSTLSATRVKGRVKTPFFSVNVAWTFELSGDAPAQIAAVQIELLASWEELLKIRPQSA